MGTKTPFKVFLFLFLSFSREKGIPKHGDENFGDYRSYPFELRHLKKESLNMGTRRRLVWF